MIYWFFRSLSALIFKTVFRIKVYGKNNIPQKGGFILASNHVSYLDPVAIGVACPRKLNFMARHDLFDNPAFSWLLYRLGAFPVKRDSADLSALKEAMKRVKQGKVLTVFPEGSRAFDGISNEPQPGIGFLAAKLNVPVVPAFIRGTYDAFPKGAKFIRPAQICVYFGQPRSFYYKEMLLNEKGRGQQISVEGGLPYQKIALDIMENIRRLAC